ncbi:hypothetical protein BAUCODRAFT_56640, partial [Baudoinia panamericana UAMH 10762]
IRVLELQPGNAGEPLHALLRPVSIHKPPSYNAISYVWGSSERSALLHLRQGTLAITASAEVVLQHLRRPNHSIVLWLDAVCINQDDTVERGEQVARMADIYHGAKDVIVWLGAAEPGDHLAFWTVELLADFYL